MMAFGLLMYCVANPLMASLVSGFIPTVVVDIMPEGAENLINRPQIQPKWVCPISKRILREF